MEDYVKIIFDLNEDITSLQNRVQYEQNKGMLMSFGASRGAAQELQKMVGFELDGLKDIASALDDRVSHMIMRRIRNIESVFTEALIKNAVGQKKYLEERDKKNE